MPYIGPHLPPHLAVQQSGEDANKSSDGESSTGAMIIRPQIPQEIQQSRTAARERENSDDEDTYGPALPPELVESRASELSKPPPTRGRISQPLSSQQQWRVLGPTLPGRDPYGVHKDEDEEYGDGDDDDDGGYGPMPQPAGGNSQSADGISEGVREFLESEERRRKEAEEAAKPKQPQREEWMLVPPSSSDLLGHLSDPTKLKARQFSRGGSSANRSAPNNLWTETPAERQQRIADEVAGKKRRAANPDLDVVVDDSDERRKRKKEEDVRMAIEEHNRTARGKSLLEIYKDEKKGRKGKRGKEDEEPGVIWDHSRDMSVGGRLMDEKDRSRLITDARSLGDRFGSGKGGSYL